jgi:PAS domain S-box-containing protein
MSLLARIFALVLIALVPAVAVETWNEVGRRREREAQLHTDALRYTRTAVAEIRNTLKGAQQTLATLAATAPVQNLDGAACDRLLSSLREQYPPFLDVLAADREGTVLCDTDASGRVRSVAGRPVFARALAKNGFVIGQYAENETASPTLSAAFPVRDAANRTIGVVLGSIQLWWFQERLISGLPAETAFVLIDRQHTILARHPETETYVGQKLPAEFVPIIARAGTGPIEGAGLDGVRRIGAVEAISFGDAPDLFVGVALSQPAAFRELDAATRRAVLLTLLGLLLATAAAIAAGRFFVERPFARLLDVARRWTEGETGARTGLSGRSEFARLGRAFDAMADAVEARTDALAASEERLRTALEATGAGTWDFDPQSGERHWSPRLFEMLGIPPGTKPNSAALLEAIHPEDRGRVEEDYRRAFEERTGRYSAEFRTRQGRWLAARGRILFSPDGRPTRSVGTVLDITDSKRVEAALFERSPVALFLIRAQPGGRFVYEEVNAAFCRYTGVTRETIVGRAPEELFDPKVAALLNHHYDTCFRSGRRHEYEIAGDLPAGYLVRRTILEPIEWDERGQVRRILAAAMDLTEARQLEAALRQAQKIEALGQLTGGVAHDFNNLLTAVLGNLWLLMRNLPEGRERRLAEHAARAAERGARLTQHLLAFARRQQMTLEPVDLNALVNNMRDLLARTLGARIEIETELAPDLWPALADPNQVELVLLNLAINARDAMPEGGPIRLLTANVRTGDRLLPPDLEGDYVMLAVADNGIGMSEAVRSRAFEPFFTTKEIGKGSGLGLSMVYGVATQSGGSAAIESAPGKGTIVRVFLKRHDATEGSA